MKPEIKVSSSLRLTTLYQTVLAAYGVGQLQLTMIHLANTTGGFEKVNICVVPPGGTPDATNAVLYEFSLPANDFIEFGENMILEAESTLQAKASADDSINITVAGIQN